MVLKTIPLPPASWLRNKKTDKSPENIPWNQVVKNKPKDRINFSARSQMPPETMDKGSKQIPNKNEINKNHEKRSDFEKSKQVKTSAKTHNNNIGTISKQKNECKKGKKTYATSVKNQGKKIH